MRLGDLNPGDRFSIRAAVLDGTASVIGGTPGKYYTNIQIGGVVRALLKGTEIEKIYRDPKVGDTVRIEGRGTDTYKTLYIDGTQVFVRLVSSTTEFHDVVDLALIECL